MNKQIEEMAYEMTQFKETVCKRIEDNKCLLRSHANAFVDCHFCKLAEHLITEKGYRKQIEGEWVKDEKSKFKHRYHCSACNFYLIGAPTKHCPNCGARMKGEEDEKSD